MVQFFFSKNIDITLQGFFFHKVELIGLSFADEEDANEQTAFQTAKEADQMVGGGG